MTFADDFVTKLIHREIHKRRKKTYNKDADITTPNVLNTSEDNKQNISLLKTHVKKKKKKNLSEMMTQISFKEKKKHQLPQEYFENNIPLVYTGEKKSKINKYNSCEKSIESHSALEKHEVKTHNLKKDEPIITTNTFNISESDEEHVSLLKSQIKKLRKKNKKASKMVLHENIKKYKRNTEHEKRSQEYTANNIINMDKINKNEVFECNACEISFKHGSALKKHQAMAHNFNKDTPIISDSDEAYTSLLKSQLTKMKKKKKKAYKEMTEELVQSNEMMKHKRKTQCVVPLEYSDCDLNSVNTEETYIKIYKCDICEKSFEQHSGLNKHRKKAHILNKDVTNTTTSISQNSSEEEEYTLLLKTLKKKMKKGKKKKKNSKTMTEELMQSNEIVSHKRKTKCVVRPKEYSGYDLSVMNTEVTSNQSLIKIYKCDICENSFERDSALNKHMKKAHILNKDTSIISLNPEDTLLLKTFKKKMENKKKMKKASKASIQLKTAMLPLGTKKHKWHTVVNEPHNEQLENHIAVIPTKMNKSNVSLKSFESEYFTQNTHKVKDLNKRNVVTTSKIKKSVETTMNTLNSPENEKECKLLLKTPVKEPKNNKNNLIKYQKTTTILKKCDEHKGCMKRNPAGHTKGTNSYKCNVCKNTFDINEQKTMLNNECNICSKSFSSRSALSRHCKLHTGGRPYKCDICGKSFKQKWNLTVHCRLHTDERPYTCDVCYRSFNEKGTLTAHYRLHTGERPYTCDVCGKTFVKAYTLTVHYRLHTGERPYKCGLCQMSFVGSGGLTRHTRSKHDRCL